MVAVPSITLILILAVMSTVGGAVLRERWMKLTAWGLAAMEVCMATFLIVLVLS